MQRKTLTQRLTNKYLLIVRNEENFADRWQFSFNFARLLVVLTFIVLLFYSFVTGLNFLGVYLMGGGDTISEEAKHLISLVAKVDSLEYALEKNDDYIMGYQSMLEGGQGRSKDTTTWKPEKQELSELSKEEEAFRKLFEKETSFPAYQSKESFTTLYFAAPISGKSTAVKLNGKTIAVEVLSANQRSVKSLDAGLVVTTSINADNTYKVVIHHQNGLLTIYNQVAKLATSPGSPVTKGQVVAESGNEKVIFSMYYNGKVLNPQEYIAWDN